MTRKEQIQNAYRLTGGNASFYDGMMTYSTLPGKAICRRKTSAIWNAPSPACRRIFPESCWRCRWEPVC